jgi:GAF domain-containing protein
MPLATADSAGVSIDVPEDGHLVWGAAAGQLAGLTGGTIPYDSSPCRMVMEHDTPLLFDRPARHFGRMLDVAPPIFECLLAPFHAHGRPMGTVWVIGHKPDIRFDAEDVRLLTSVCAFAAAGHQLATAAATAMTARDLLEHRVLERTAELEKELASTRRLHEVVSGLLGCDDVLLALDEVLAAAIDVADARFGNVQLLRNGGRLEIVAQRGFGAAFLEQFRSVDANDVSACGRALRRRTPVLIEDVEADPDYAPHRRIAAVA